MADTRQTENLPAVCLWRVLTSDPDRLTGQFIDITKWKGRLMVRTIGFYPDGPIPISIWILNFSVDVAEGVSVRTDCAKQS